MFQILARKPPHGSTIIELVRYIPKYTLQIAHDRMGNNIIIRIHVQLRNPTDIEKQCTLDKNTHMVLLVGDSSNTTFIYEKYTHEYMAQNKHVYKSFRTTCTGQYEVYVHFMSQTWGKAEYKVILKFYTIFFFQLA